MKHRTEAVLVLPDGTERLAAAGGAARDLLRAAEFPHLERVLAVKVDGVLRDLAAPVPPGARVEAVVSEHPEALALLRHSAAHLMATAIQELFPGTQFAIGPAIADGFYYDLQPPRPLTPEDLPAIEAKMADLVRARLPFERTEEPLEAALAHARSLGQPFKVEILEALRTTGSSRPDAELTGEAEPGARTVSWYRSGPFLDLCRGPHVPDTSYIPAFRLTHLAGAYWRGDERRPMLTRVYGTAFFTREALEAHLFRLEEAKRRDHRRLGRELDLFSTAEEVGGGLILWHPRGGLVRKLMEDFWREAHLAEGYDLVFSPHVGRELLWKTSGHLDFYQEYMYAPMELEGQNYYVKPMNCPFHIMIYKAKGRSYRDLPLRYAELGTVYRFERSGVLHGLLRVRGFTQDDAHLFCRPDQMEAEVLRCVEFSLFILRAFGFTDVETWVATRPPKAVGDEEMWDRATEALKGAARQAGLSFQVEEGGGAFYGPKIDLKIKDSLGRPWQCTTIQFDFNLPERFDITFVGEDNRAHRPLVIHRALLGSLERFLGVLLEHYAGALPFWLAPVQVRLLPVADRHHGYAGTVAASLREGGLRVDLDARNEKVGFKVREAELQKVPYVLVVGDREAAAGGVSIRARGRQTDLGQMPVGDFVTWVRAREEIPAPRRRDVGAGGGASHQ
ncbi:MAG: threonine--tRNA ligase [candidate division NC10 bacterium]|nr:threonine--tRNA ligase [candidate division NC10 bacterium]